MRGIKHVGQWRDAVIRGEVLEELSVPIRRRRAPDLDDEPDLSVLVGDRGSRRRRRRHGRGALVSPAVVNRRRRGRVS